MAMTPSWSCAGDSDQFGDLIGETQASDLEPFSIISTKGPRQISATVPYGTSQPNDSYQGANGRGSVVYRGHGCVTRETLMVPEYPGRASDSTSRPTTSNSGRAPSVLHVV